MLSIRSIPLFIFQSRTEGTHPFSIRNLPLCSNSLQALLCRLLAGKQLKNIIESIHERRTVIVLSDEVRATPPSLSRNEGSLKPEFQ